MATAPDTDLACGEWVWAEEQARQETRAGLLASLKETTAVRAAAEVAAVQAVLDWCGANEVLHGDEAFHLAGYGEHALHLGGPGCPGGSAAPGRPRPTGGTSTPGPRGTP